MTDGSGRPWRRVLFRFLAAVLAVLVTAGLAAVWLILGPGPG